MHPGERGSVQRGRHIRLNELRGGEHGDFGIHVAERMRHLDGVLDELGFGVEIRCDSQPAISDHD